MGKKRTTHAIPGKSSAARVARPYPRASLEEALRIPQTLKDKNGGNPWPPEDIAKVLGITKKSNRFFYLAAASRAFGLTDGGRDSKLIALSTFGRDLVYAPDKSVEETVKKQAFLKVEKFRQVLEYYKGSKLPEMKYLSNTLEREFGLPAETHVEFSKLFRDNCDYLGIGEGFARTSAEHADNEPPVGEETKGPRDTVTLAEPEKETGLKVFVIMVLILGRKGCWCILVRG